MVGALGATRELLAAGAIRNGCEAAHPVIRWTTHAARSYLHADICGYRVGPERRRAEEEWERKALEKKLKEQQDEQRKKAEQDARDKLAREVQDEMRRQAEERRRRSNGEQQK